MTPSRSDHERLDAEMQRLKAEEVPFAMATVVRTVNATSAKPGGKALLDQDGNILVGWVGGGCARSAVGKAAQDAISSGLPQYISLRPQELLDTEGVEPGDERDGVLFARNGCPSKGTMDLFVEPVLPLAELIICGDGLVAMALAELAARLDFNVTMQPDVTALSNTSQSAFVVIATQGKGDLAALKAISQAHPRYVSFVGSRTKFATLKEKLVAEAPEFEPVLAQVKAPAGLDINAITPDEIALSILAEITQNRRKKSAQNSEATKS